MKPLLAAWVCWAIVGLSPVAGKFAVGVISPALLVFLGTLIGVLYFTPWITKNHKWGELVAKETLWKFLFIGTFGTAQRGYFTAERTLLFPFICLYFSARISQPPATGRKRTNCTGCADYPYERAIHPALDGRFADCRQYLDVAGRLHISQKTS